IIGQFGYIQQGGLEIEIHPHTVFAMVNDGRQITDPKTKKAALDEQIEDLRLNLEFTSSAFAFTESPNLPVGEFFIRELHAKLQHYPHEFHDFNADIYVEDENLRLIDFSGELDSSDFHFSGRLVHYDTWMNDVLNGDTELEFDLTSNHLQLEDLFVYQGENYVPEDYRHEAFDDLKLHGRSALHFKDHSLHSIDLYLDQLSCTMKLHQARFERFKGRFHYEDQHLETHDFEGQIGRSDFHIDLYWYLGEDPELKRKDHFVALKSKKLDINQLLEWNPPPSNASPTETLDHDAGFTIFDLPFWDMHMRLKVDDMVYHQYKIQNLEGVARMRSNRHLLIDTLYMTMAGGDFDIKGDFDARDTSNIYFSPDIYVENLDLDRFFVKFDNFGQDYLVSDNLHGTIDGDISGKLHIHKDLTPMLDKSEFVMNMEVHQGRLDNYQPMEYLENYFKDKNLKRIRFDTLRNTLEFKNNILNIPVMTINSSLGFIELWGTQSLDDKLETDLFIKVPLKLITRAVFQKLFKRKREDLDPEQEDAIEYRNGDKKFASVQVNLRADADGYEVKLKKDKDLKREQRKKMLAERRAKRKAKHEAEVNAR
ncbi:MAG: AsmA-like C-terminal region-containing protein, partial [Bacteroidota bacterium]